MGKRLPPDQLGLYKRIDVILWEDWDPIGVNVIAEARDEYQSYLPGIFALALDRCDVDEIADRLHLIERQAMGLPGNRDHCVWVGEKIREERIEILGPV
jgi:hypothetical protein